MCFYGKSKKEMCVNIALNMTLFHNVLTKQ